jgi:hypothetical protein
VTLDGFEDVPAYAMSLAIDPRNVTVFLDASASPPTPAVYPFIVSERFSDGHTEDVTKKAAFSCDDPKICTCVANECSFDLPPCVPYPSVCDRTTVLHAKYASFDATATVTLVELRKTGDHRDFYFEVPFLADPTPPRDVLKFDANIEQTDVVLSIDTSSSMSSSLDALKTSLSTKLIPGLFAAIPSVGVAVVDHKDSDASDVWTVSVPQVVTTDATKAESAIAALVAGGGGDEPQAQEIAMDFALTGEAFATMPPISKHAPAPGTSGGVDLRTGSLVTVVEITDAHWHDAHDLPWSSGASYDDQTRLASDFAAAHARFIGVVDMHLASSRTTPFDLLTQPRALSDATSSAVEPSAFSPGATGCPTGVGGATIPPDAPGAGRCRLVFQITDGAASDVALVDAVHALAVENSFDVTAVVSNDPTNAPGPDGKTIDATRFVDHLRAMDEGSPKDGCPAHAAKDTDGDGFKDTFPATPIGDAVCFEIVPKMNNFVPARAAPQTFQAFVDLIGMPGAIELGQRTILFLVPPPPP